jgi:excisionase family DNA binding protein
LSKKAPAGTSTELLTTYAVAKLVGVHSTRTIRRAIESGKLRAVFNAATGRYYVSRRDADRFKKARER